MTMVRGILEPPIDVYPTRIVIGKIDSIEINGKYYNKDTKEEIEVKTYTIEDLEIEQKQWEKEFLK